MPLGGALPSGLVCFKDSAPPNCFGTDSLKALSGVLSPSNFESGSTHPTQITPTPLLTGGEFWRLDRLGTKRGFQKVMRVSKILAWKIEMVDDSAPIWLSKIRFKSKQIKKLFSVKNIEMSPNRPSDTKRQDNGQYHITLHRDTLCNTLRHTATHCNTLHHTHWIRPHCTTP